MRIHVVIFFSLFFTGLDQNVSAQIKHDYNWVFGAGHFLGPKNILDFNASPPQIQTPEFAMDIYLSNSSICDEMGGLLFYTNGCFINGRTHQLMMNGDSLNPGYTFNERCESAGYPVPQGLIILPKPLNDSSYLIFHQRDTFIRQPRIEFPIVEFLYTEVDMRLNGGLGAVVKKNIPILQTQLNNGLLTAVKHSNNQDWWLITSKRWENILYVHHVQSDTITTMEQVIGRPVPNESRSGGQAVFSPDGTRYAQYHPTDGVYLYDFDRSTGQLSNFQHITFVDSAFVGGLAFAPNSRYLYVMAQLNIYQFDVQADDIAASKILVAEYDGFAEPFPTTFYLSQLAPDCRIYITPPNGVRQLSYINYPNRRGVACDVQQHAIEFPTSHRISIPNFSNYRLGTEYAVCDSSFYTSVEEVKKEDKINFTIFPNPTLGEITISANATAGIQQSLLSIQNLTGQLVRQLIVDLSSPFSLDIAALPAGVYFLQIEGEDGVSITKKVVKQ